MEKLLDRLDTLKARQTQANLIFKPLFYRLHDAGDRRKFEACLETPGLIVTDQIFEQMKELVRFKNPSIRFSPADLEAETKKYLAGQDLHATGVWIYYPWSNRLVHSLDEEDFINIRTSRNQYKITREERDLLAQKKIGVIGLSVGQSVSVTLAMERICGELRLADFDTLELNNLNRIRAGIHNLGLPKVYSVAREIAEIDPFLKVTCFTQGLTEENMDDFFLKDGRLDLLIEESDGFDIKILSRYKARALKIPVLMEASDRCMVDVERFDLEPERGILHGIVDHLDVNTLKSLQTNEEKIPYMLDVLGIETSSIRLKASMVEMNQTINTWPQLASAVTMGGGITADVARRLLLNQYTGSGRFHVDIEEIIGNKKSGADAANPSSYIELEPARMRAICSLMNLNEASEAEDSELEKIAQAASLAPSYANRQPWKWATLRQYLFLFADRNTSAAFIDPLQLGAYTSLGATLENALLQAAALGLQAQVEFFPVKAEPDLVAGIRFQKSPQPAPDEQMLAAYIPKRHTNLRPGNGKAIEPPVLEELRQMATQFPGIELALATDPEKINGLARAVGIAERIRLLHPQANHDTFSTELKWSSGHQPVLEGVDIKTLELPVLAETAYQVISDSRVSGLLHNWEKGIAFENMTAHTVRQSAVIGLISAAGRSSQNVMEAGMAVQKLWLSTTKNNLGFQPICVPLYLLEHLGSSATSKLFSSKLISDLENIKTQVLHAFPAASARENLFLFRLFRADAPAITSLRKPLKEVYFKL